MSKISSITNPLGLRDKLKSPARGLSIIPLIDIALLALFVSLFTSELIFAPGMPINLPDTPKSLTTNSQNASVLTVNEGEMLFFEGHIHSLNSLQKAFKKHLRSTTNLNPSLLIKIHHHNNIQVLFEICNIAKAAGFNAVHIASDSQLPTPAKKAS